MPMRRVVVTGYGAVSPCGLTAADSWSAIREGRSGIAPIALFDASEFTTHFAGECKGFVPEHYIPKRDVRTMDRFIHLAIAAAIEATTSSSSASAP
jgi:3-oxoacyl-[acyl-carrier-protein] synthase II